MPRPWTKILIVGALLLANLISVTAYLQAPTLIVDILPGAISSDSGFAYVTPVSPKVSWPYEIGNDSIHGAQSQLRLLEDGLVLGPSNRQHDVIRNRGVGGFSHWGNALWFSTTDNSDPRSNGRVYKVQIQAQLNATAAFLMFVLAVASVGAILLVLPRARILALRKDVRCQMLAFGCIASAIATTLAVGLVDASGLYPLLTPDSGSYYDWPDFRGYFYWALLHLLQATTTTSWSLVALQIAALITSFVTLSFAIARIGRSFLVGSIAVCALLLNVEVVRHSMHLMSEPLFVSMFAFHLGFALLCLQNPSYSNLAMTGIFGGLAILMRPAGYSILPCALLLSVLLPARKLRGLMLVGGAASLVLLAGALPSTFSSDRLATVNHGGIALVGQVIALGQADTETAYPELYRRIYTRIQPHIHSRDSSWPHEYWGKTTNDYNWILWHETWPEILKHVGQAAEPDSPPSAPPNVLNDADRVAMSLSISVIRDNPVGYARLVAAHVYGMWHVLIPHGPPLNSYFDQNIVPFRNSASIREFLQQVPPRPATLGNRATVELIWDWIRPAALSLRLPLAIASACALVAAFAMVFLAKTIPRTLAGSIYCGMQLWANFLLVAMTQPALDRYAVMMYPAALTSFLLLLTWVVHQILLPQRLLEFVRASRFRRISLDSAR